MNFLYKINIFLGRRLLPIIMTTYIPTILLSIISHATNYFKPFFFEAQVTVNLTSLLVMVTLFVNVSYGTMMNLDFFRGYKGMDYFTPTSS